MKSLRVKLLVANAVLFFIFLAGLGIVLGQFFQLFSLDPEKSVEQAYWFYLAIVLVLGGGLYFLLVLRIFSHYIKPVDLANTTARRIAAGDYLARVPQTNEDEYDESIGLSINQLARNLQEVSILRSMEKERLNTLIESMGSGLLMFGREGSVNLLNGAFLRLFGASEEELIGKTFKEVNLPEEIKELIEDVFMREQVCEKNVRIQKENSSTHLSVYGAPVIGKHGNWLGIIIVLHDITELIRLEEVRKDFVANVSHELRTPITSIKGFTETLLDGAMENPDVLRDFLNIIQKESERLKLLVDDLLELSGIEQERFHLEKRPVHVLSFIEDAAQIVSGPLEKKRMKIELLIEPDLKVEADAARLVQVMVNLFSNAINYSDEQTKITVTARQKERETVIEVKDEGMGISEKELPRLFERFYRVDRARSRESGGTGLGLAIVKHLVEAHGGRVTAESTAGKGSAFAIHLPN